LELLEQTLRSNWLAPLGPQVDTFEIEFAAAVEVGHAAAVASGTAALHLALRLLGVEPGDRVICPTLTFVATANAIAYLGAEPVFIDCDEASWNMDPELLGRELDRSHERGEMPKAVIAVDLYGQCADYEQIEAICDDFGVPLVEDAAEALGASFGRKPAGGFGKIGVFSFNGNKIITTSGGGMLVSDDENFTARARHLASQARDEQPHYEHSELGYNYRMSNLLAAVGRAQLMTLTERVARRRANFAAYQELLGNLPGVDFMPEATYGRSTRWLTCLTVEESAFGASPKAIREALEADDIECRPLWKPMHLQPLYRSCRVRGGQVSERLFAQGLCLPSGTDLTPSDLERISTIVHRCRNQQV
jgi:pyridoxal phosphate-dependent aminotransferase EpsN